MFRRKKTGQSTAEYAIVIGLVIAAAVAMQVYVKRGIQAKIKGTVDYQPNATGSTTFHTGQYEPYYQESSMESTRIANTVTKTNEDGEVIRTIDNAEKDVTSTWGHQTTKDVNSM